MTNEEFSNNFDTLLNSYKHNLDFNLLSSLADIAYDEYEKSLFLTQALENVITSYFNGNTNLLGEGFDESSRRLLDFSNLITVKKFDPTDIDSTAEAYSDNGFILDVSDMEAAHILNERITTLYTDGEGVTTVTSYVVKPIHYLEYDRMMSRPYRLPLKRLAWRLFSNAESSSDSAMELILRNDSLGNFKEYIVRYIRKPRPIILEDLTNTMNGLSIGGYTEETECELNPSIHYDILNEAVRLAMASAGVESKDLQTARKTKNQQTE